MNFSFPGKETVLKTSIDTLKTNYIQDWKKSKSKNSEKATALVNGSNFSNVIVEIN